MAGLAGARRHLPLALAVCLLPSAANGQGSFQLPGTDAVVSHFRPVGQDAALGRIIGGAVGPDGAVYVVDPTTAEVLRFDSDGRLVWRQGRRGQGPGEYLFPYRVAAGPDGRVYVYDVEARRLSFVMHDGKYLDRRSLPYDFDLVDNLVVLPGGDIAVVGVLSRLPEAASYGVHLFDSDLRYLRSFGPLPVTRDSTLLRYWGAGGVSESSDGDIIYTRRNPYEIHRFDSTGYDIRVVRSPLLDGQFPEDLFHLTRNGDEQTVSMSGDHAFMALPAHQFGRLVVTGRGSRKEKFFDVFGTDGELCGTAHWPAHLSGIIGVDHMRRLIWFVGEQDDAPVLYRAQLDTAGTAVRSACRLRR